MLAVVLDLGMGEVVDTLVTAAAGIGALFALIIYAKRTFVFVRKIGDGVEFVSAQMANNGGSTLKDAIDRTEALALQTVERLDAIDARVEFLEAVHRKQDEVDAIVAENQRRIADIRPTLHLPKEGPHAS
jgi:hypothetical protein